MVNLILKAVKVAVPLVAGYGVHTVVENAIKSTTPANLSKFKDLAVQAGGLALTFIVADKVSEYVDTRVDAGTKLVKKMLKKDEKEEKPEEKNEEA